LQNSNSSAFPIESFKSGFGKSWACSNGNEVFSNPKLYCEMAARGSLFERSDFHARFRSNKKPRPERKASIGFALIGMASAVETASTRGKNFTLARLEMRLCRPCCVLRAVRLLFVPPGRRWGG